MRFGRRSGTGVAVIDSALATASVLAELLAINELHAPGGSSPAHLQLTTGDVARFRDTAALLFGSEFAAVEPVVIPEAA